MYFYFFNGYSSTSSFNKVPRIFVQPFVFNNVVFDENNLPYIQVLYSSYYTIYKLSTSVDPQQQTEFLKNTNQNECRKFGYPYLVTSQVELKENYLSSVKSKIINGKYKKNTKLEPFTYRALNIGITIPIKHSISYQGTTKEFKYLFCSSYNSWYVYGTFNPQDMYIGSYSTPNIITNKPSDLTQVKITATLQDFVIDFGQNNQEVPEPFYNWFIQNFERVYENAYTIKSVTGSTLTTLTEAPPMISATLSAVGNAKYLTLKGENNTNYTMEWTSETPQGKIFAGLTTSKGGSIVIPVGKTSTINFTESTDLYEVWQTYRPPATTFDINLYKNSAEPNKVDKTAELSTVGTISGVLRQECSLINPEIIIQYDKPPDFNYCYIANFGRYYYVENIVSMRQNLWRVRLRCDVLMTYKTQILNLTARIARQQYTYSYRQIDSEIPFTNDPEITVQDIPNNLNLGKPHYENILLTVVGNDT